MRTAVKLSIDPIANCRSPIANWTNSSSRLGNWKLAIGNALLWSLLIVCSACTPRFSQEFLRELTELDALLEEKDTCGPTEIENLIPDCPLPGVCFSPACGEHDLCYTTCGMKRVECDELFSRALKQICLDSLPFGSKEYTDCRYAALTFYLGVVTLGSLPFEIVQAAACAAVEAEIRGACCSFGSPPVCADGVTREECPTGAVFLLDTTCAALAATFGGCPAPTNDACENWLPVCSSPSPSADWGFCSDVPETNTGRGVCSITLQDCPNQEPCLPVRDATLRCLVPTDNRLATTDARPIGGSCFEPDSFQADVWFEAIAPCSGFMTIRMCSENTYDATLAVYASPTGTDQCECPDPGDVPTACNDDFCLPFRATSGVDLAVTQGTCYLIRVGGWSPDGTPDAAERGVSELDIGYFCEGMETPGPVPEGEMAP